MRHSRIIWLYTVALRIVWAAVVLLGLSLSATATPPPPQIGVMLQQVHLGVLCNLPEGGREPAPDTSLGYTAIVLGEPKITFEQQHVPAALGVEFGLIFNLDHDIENAINKTYRPGQTEPDSWIASYSAEQTAYRGFSFDFPEELLLGRWVLEGWEGDTLLYRIAFDIVPEAAFPGIVAQCQAMS